MAHLWNKRADVWEAHQLAAKLTVLGSRCSQECTALAPNEHNPTLPADSQIVRANESGPPAWALVTRRKNGTRVNGRPVLAGLCVLSDRDEIRTVGGDQYFFSTERLATPVKFPAMERTIFCGRCREEIVVGSLAVCCPGASCGVWYHQLPDRPCFTYHDKCTICGQPTSLDAGFSWTPEV